MDLKLVENTDFIRNNTQYTFSILCGCSLVNVFKKEKMCVVFYQSKAQKGNGIKKCVYMLITPDTLKSLMYYKTTLADCIIHTQKFYVDNQLIPKSKTRWEYMPAKLSQFCK